MDGCKNFKKSVLKLGGEEIPSYENKKLGMTLVALKDEDDNVRLFIYDKGTYKELYYISNGITSIILLDAPNEFLYVYKKVNFKYNDVNYFGYNYLPYQNNNQYLVYGINLDTNEKGFYIYDKVTDGLIRYGKKDLVKDNGLVLLILLLGLIIFVWFIKLLKKLFTSKEKKIEKLKKKIDKLNDEYEDEEEEEEPVITKIEDEKPLPKKNRKAKRQELIDAKKVLDKGKPKSVRRVSLEPDEMDDYDF